MKLKNSLKDVSLGTLIVAVSAALFFILTLGFITSYYPLFYDGNSETYEFFMVMQRFNSFIFDAGLVIAIFTILMIPFDIHKRKANLLVMIFLAAFIAYVGYLMSVLLQVVPGYIQSYNALDLAFMPNYTATTIPLMLSYIIVGVILVTLILMLGSTVVRYFRLRSALKKEEGAVSYEQ